MIRTSVRSTFSPYLGSSRRCTATRASTQDRVLRYPDGNVRHIRYPVSETIDDEDDVGTAWDVACFPSRPQQSAAKPAAVSPSQPQLQPRQKAPAKPQPQPKQPEATPSPPQHAITSSSDAPAAYASGPSSSNSGSATPSTNLSDTTAFLESLFVSSYAAAQPEVDINHCFQVLDGCPWLIPRPVYVLTLGELRPGDPLAAGSSSPSASGGDSLVGCTYTLRTKVVQKDASGQLAQLLGKPHLASALEVAHMRDGVVTFETPDAAAIYATRLEEEGETKVTVAEVDSHKLFRLASDTRALVVLVTEDNAGQLPAPFQLAAALKGQRAWDDM